MNNVRNTIIIGSGPAGYAAAIYLSRATLKPLLLAGDQFGGQLMYTTEVENYPGFPDGIMGVKLMMDIRKQAEKFGTKILNKKVTKVDFTKRPFEVWSGEERFLGNSVVIATGAEAVRLNLKNENKFYGKGLSTCAICDAAFYKNKKVAVVGGGDAACEDVLALTKFTKDILLIVRRNELRASKIMQERVVTNSNIKIFWNTEVVEILGEDKIERIRMVNNIDNKENIENIDGLFYAIGHKPQSKMFKNIVDINEKGYILTSLNGLATDTQIGEIWLNKYPTMTSVDGVFAAGDVIDFRYRQATTASGMGVMAALDVEKWLSEK